MGEKRERLCEAILHGYACVKALDGSIYMVITWSSAFFFSLFFLALWHWGDGSFSFVIDERALHGRYVIYMRLFPIIRIYISSS